MQLLVLRAAEMEGRIYRNGASNKLSHGMEWPEIIELN